MKRPATTDTGEAPRSQSPTTENIDFSLNHEQPGQWRRIRGGPPSEVSLRAARAPVARPRLLAAYLIGTLAAFGGIYAWALPGVLCGAVLLCGLAPRRPPPPPHDTHLIDRAIVVVIVAVGLQIVPLPLPLRSVLSPNLAALESTLFATAALEERWSGALSLHPAGTLEAVLLLVATACTYWAARATFSVGGLRTVCRAIATAGAVFGTAAIVHRALTPRLIYGFWQPADAGALPLGPVVNRNHFAGWLLMAGALVAGYLLASLATRGLFGGQRPRFRRTAVALARSGIATTGAAWVAITLTVIAAESRSAILGLVVAVAAIIKYRARSWRAVATAAGVTVVVAMVSVLSGQSAVRRIADRFADTPDGSNVSRLVIWRESMPIVNDFWATGVGAGAYGRAMLTYQRTQLYASHLGSDRHFNHAHNHYLQLLAEGGVLVVIPVVVLLAAFARVVRARLRHDPGEIRTVRAGAVAGLLGIAVQSVWEVPLTMPAAALLAAALAAVATHERLPDARDRGAPLAQAANRANRIPH